MELLTTQLVHERVWAITGAAHDLMYLVEGSRKALLIDTGFGIGDLVGVVTRLTSLPITVVNTHGHPDHAGGNSRFSEVWLHPADEKIMRRMCTHEYRYQDVLRGNQDTGVDTEPLLKALAGDRPYKLRHLETGQFFDLGDRRLEVVEVPGHTPGCICLIERHEKLLFTGDTVVSTPVWMYLKHSKALGIYLSSLEKLNALQEDFDLLFPGHPPTPLKTDHFDDLVACAREILKKPGRGVPTKTFVGDGVLWKHNAASIIYDPKKL